MTRCPDSHPGVSQAADFEFSPRAAGGSPFGAAGLGAAFFGKLAGLSSGHAYTHARDAELDMAALAHLCNEAGTACAPAVARCVTASHALELLLADPAGSDALAAVIRRAAQTARVFSAGRPVSLHLFHTDGRELMAL